MNKKEIIAEILEDFQPATTEPEEKDALITQQQATIEQCRLAEGRWQAKIDALMLEYCPDEMTDAQVNNWASHQKPVKEPS